jgi:hypothetical protein
MRKSMGLGVVGTLAIAGMLLALTGGPAAAAGAGTAYTCAGGSIPTGDYSSITVTGFCDVVPDAVINVAGNLNVAPGAAFDAQTVPSTITVGKNVTVGAGAMAGLGCQPPALVHNSAHPCSNDYGPSHTDYSSQHSTITVKGNVTGTDAMVVLLNGITVNRNVTLTGGGGPIPWSVKNNTVGRNITMNGITDEWVGVMFNHVAGNVTLTNITVNDEHPGAPGVYIVQNNVGRNLICSRLEPGVSSGFSGVLNVVGHKAIGQCAALA